MLRGAVALYLTLVFASCGFAAVLSATWLTGAEIECAAHRLKKLPCRRRTSFVPFWQG
jgi:hypothetical protein